MMLLFGRESGPVLALYELTVVYDSNNNFVRKPVELFRLRNMDNISCPLTSKDQRKARNVKTASKRKPEPR